jgi:hypothetical protein
LTKSNKIKLIFNQILDDLIVIENLQPGKSYCFNGWAYNSCGAGPVFNLEGVCAENSHECTKYSTEHCEYDLDYQS